MEETEKLKEEILRIKKEKGIYIMAHNYQIPDIQDIADFIGDSLQLAVEATKIDTKKILFCGVRFMAETIAVLNPDKKIIVPVAEALCPLANSLKLKTLLEFKKRYPGVPVVLYVNSTVECKAEADYICTSANAVKLVEKIPSDTILFGPDKNLASYVQYKTGKNIIPVPGESGYCYVHNFYSLEDILIARKKYPDAVIVVHPEVPKEVWENADYVASTSQMLKVPEKEKDKKRFVIGTEIGLIYRLQKMFPEKEFIPLREEAICWSMKANNLQNVLKALKEEAPVISVPKELAEKAYIPIKRMTEVLEETKKN